MPPDLGELLTQSAISRLTKIGPALIADEGE
jgi:hypothetical protein